LRVHEYQLDYNTLILIKSFTTQPIILYYIVRAEKFPYEKGKTKCHVKQKIIRPRIILLCLTKVIKK